jgi:DNA replication protein DnaD
VADPQPNDPHLRLAHEILEQVMAREFSKRQRNILDLILRLSWGCGKKHATIPELKDFEVVGVLRTHVTTELEYLVRSRVITWERSESAFAFIKDYDTWAVSFSRTYNEQHMARLVHLNIIDGSRNGNRVTKTVITETVTDQSELPKQELFSYQNSNRNEPETHAPPDLKEGLKKVFIESNNNSSSNSSSTDTGNEYELENLVDNPVESVDNSENSEGAVVRFITNQFLITASPFQVDTLVGWCESVEPSLIIWAMERALKAGKNGRIDYVEGVIKKCLAAGIKTRTQAERQLEEYRATQEQKRSPGPGRGLPKSIQQQLDDEKNGRWKNHRVAPMPTWMTETEEERLAREQERIQNRTPEELAELERRSQELMRLLGVTEGEE